MPLVVAGSTHAGEEAAALDALDAARAAGLAAALVLAPRHPERFEEVARLVPGRGRTLRRRTRPGPGRLADGEVLLLDSIGELAGLYRAAAVAFVGGSLVPVGGHSPIEPAAGGAGADPRAPHRQRARRRDASPRRGRARCAVLDAGRARGRRGRGAARPGREARPGRARPRPRSAPHRGATERTLALLARVRAGAPEGGR